MDATLITLLCTVVGGALGLWWRIEARIGVERSERKRLEDKLNDFELEVAKSFVSHSTLEKAEDRLAITMDKLSARIETAISRLENIGVEVAKLVTRETHRDRDQGMG